MSSAVIAVMLIGTALSAAVGTWLVRNGFRDAGEAILVNGYLVAMMLSMPFWLTKGQSRRSQRLMVGVPTLFVIALALLNWG